MYQHGRWHDLPAEEASFDRSASIKD